MAGPGYTVNDLVYYMGLFGGIIGVYLGTAPLGLHPLLRLVGGLIVGVGCGWVLEKLYTKATRWPDDPNQR
jgi:hypothetical protein